MADRKTTLVDAGIKFLRYMLGEKEGPAVSAEKPAGPIKLEDLKLDDLKREKVRLEQEERKLLADIRDLEGQKKKLFEDGVRNASQREQVVLARRIKELDMQAANMDRMLQSISKQMRTINGLVQIKDRIRLNNESGLASIISNLDLGDLVTYIDKASVDGEFHMTKLDEILRAMEKAEAVSPQYSEDQDVLDIVKQMERAREAGENPQVMDRYYEEMNQRMDSKPQEGEEEA